MPVLKQIRKTEKKEKPTDTKAETMNIVSLSLAGMTNVGYPFATFPVLIHLS